MIEIRRRMIHARDWIWHFLAQAIVFVVAIPHLAGVCVALWLDEDVVKKYLDGIVAARRDLDPRVAAALRTVKLRKIERDMAIRRLERLERMTERASTREPVGMDQVRAVARIDVEVPP